MSLVVSVSVSPPESESYLVVKSLQHPGQDRSAVSRCLPVPSPASRGLISRLRLRVTTRLLARTHYVRRFSDSHKAENVGSQLSEVRRVPVSIREDTNCKV